MLRDSCIYSFINQKEGFVVHFFEGQKLIQDLIVISNIESQALSYFRDAILSFMPMITFLGPKEGFGLYIDGEDPYFRFKLETSASGHMRTLLIPDNLEKIDIIKSGKIRLSKTFSAVNKPYTSLLNIENSSLGEIVNDILKNSYQLDGREIISNKSDQSLMVMRLPDVNVDKSERENRPSLEEYILKHKVEFNKILDLALQDEKEIETKLEKLDLVKLKSRSVEFKCPCSREMMVTGVMSIGGTNFDDLFDEGKDSLETKCDYCNTYYLITKDELKRFN